MRDRRQCQQNGVCSAGRAFGTSAVGDVIAATTFPVAQKDLPVKSALSAGARPDLCDSQHRFRPWRRRTHDEVDPAKADASNVEKDGQDAHEDAEHADGGAREVDDLSAARVGVDVRPAPVTVLSGRVVFLLSWLSAACRCLGPVPLLEPQSRGSAQTLTTRGWLVEHTLTEDSSTVFGGRKLAPTDSSSQHSNGSESANLLKSRAHL